MDFGDFRITKREMLVSVSLIAIMLVIGILISGNITEARLDRNEIYNKAVKIESADLFEYGMRTNVGNAFVYGDLKAVDTVTYPEIGGEYMYVRKVKEEYTKHTRIVTKTRTNSKGEVETYKEEEVYWSWDEVWWDSMACDEVSFLGVVFDSDKINRPPSGYIDTIYKWTNVRYKYYGTGTEFTGTIFTELRDGTISDGSHFFENKTCSEALERMQAFDWTGLFWAAWISLTGFVVYSFYYIDNKWLE